jgi:hypothetical protein
LALLDGRGAEAVGTAVGKSGDPRNCPELDAAGGRGLAAVAPAGPASCFGAALGSPGCALSSA